MTYISRMIQRLIRRCNRATAVSQIQCSEKETDTERREESEREREREKSETDWHKEGEEDAAARRKAGHIDHEHGDARQNRVRRRQKDRK